MSKYPRGSWRLQYKTRISWKILEILNIFGSLDIRLFDISIPIAPTAISKIENLLLEGTVDIP